jgi:hypothetical protein
MLKDVVVNVHPPTAGVGGVLCIDGGGTRGVLPLKNIKKIEDRIGLPIRPQRFFKIVVGTSSGMWCKESSRAQLTSLRWPGRCWTIYQRVDGRRGLT